MRVAITYEIWDHATEAAKRIVGPHTVEHEYPSEQAAKDACLLMCRTNFPDTAHTSREYIVNTKVVL